MEADKDFIKTSLGNEHADAETTFTHLTNSHVKADINLGSLGVVSDNMSVTVDSSSIDHHLKVDVGMNKLVQLFTCCWLVVLGFNTTFRSKVYHGDR